MLWLIHTKKYVFESYWYIVQFSSFIISVAPITQYMHMRNKNSNT